jgi:hypothetical protein
MAFQGVRHRRRPLATPADDDLRLFTEVRAHRPDEATAAGQLR